MLGGPSQSDQDGVTRRGPVNHAGLAGDGKTQTRPLPACQQDCGSNPQRRTTDGHSSCLLLPHSCQPALVWRTVRASGSPASLPVLQPSLLGSQWELSKIRVMRLSCLKPSILLKEKANSFPEGRGLRSPTCPCLPGPHPVAASPLSPHPHRWVIQASAECSPQGHLCTHT